MFMLPAAPLWAQSAGAGGTAPAASAGHAAPAAVPATSAMAQVLPDAAAYVAQQFGPSYKVDPKFPPLVGDLNGDGQEDLVLVGTSSTPLISQEEFYFKVEDPYDAYFGTGDVKITSQFSLHFDGSGKDLLIVMGWRQQHAENSKHIAKFVIINTPFERISLIAFRHKKKTMQAIEAVDKTGMHSLVAWHGKHWEWSAQSMSDEPFGAAIE
jgi:hypothetical protein